MTHQPTFSDAQIELLLDLLETERRELPVEIRHTDNETVHEQLRQRQRMVEELIRQLQPLATAGRA